MKKCKFKFKLASIILKTCIAEPLTVNPSVERCIGPLVDSKAGFIRFVTPYFQSNPGLPS